MTNQHMYALHKHCSKFQDAYNNVNKGALLYPVASLGRVMRNCCIDMRSILELGTVFTWSVHMTVRHSRAETFICQLDIYKEHLYKFLEQSCENFYFIFFRKCNFIKTGTCQFKAKTQKQAIFKPNLFGMFYSTLNFLSNDIQYA